ncbi:MAG: alpha/beta hydrolase [Alphaproteobacteria bacterium]|nr:alpha/beta hydrolase [Alphaproteobacteria bacterium]
MMRRLAAAIFLLLLGACTPHIAAMGPPVETPRIDGESLVMADGTALPMTIWRPDGPPKAVILALHGFNDYAIAFADPAVEWVRDGIATYAYDQRGFGRGPQRGLWPGTETLVADLETALALVQARHPGVPVYVLGESMGASVIMVAGAQGRLDKAAGTILLAPAVRGRETLNVFARVGLFVFSRTVPWLAGRPAGPLPFRPSDNVAALRKLGRDPLVIKDTRVDAFWGLVNLMDDALEAARRFDAPALVLIGRRDDLIPGGPMETMLQRLPPAPAGRRRIVAYPEGYHLLLRDLKAEVPIRDIAHWTRQPTGPLPSGNERRAGVP